jgi:hypothetical protein
MEWFKKHADTVVILGAVIGSMLWMNGKFNEIDKRFTEIEKDIAVMKTVMIMRNLMPKELAKELAQLEDKNNM